MYFQSIEYIAHLLNIYHTDMTTVQNFIPLNDRSFFIIKKGEWDYSIDIMISDYFDFNIFNLFMIFKSYVYEEDIYIVSVYSIVSKDDEISFTYNRINLEIVKKYDFNSFVFYIENLVYSEKEYIKNYKYMGFRIIFNKNSKIIKENKIYPIYPWNVEVKNALLNKSSFKDNYNIKIKIFEENEIKLKEKIAFLEKELSKNKK